MKPRFIELMKTCNYTVKPKNKDFIRPTNKVMGFDTETYDGKVTLISDSERRYSIIQEPKEIFDFLTLKKYKYTINFFFNLTYDVNAVLKHIDPLIREKLAKFNKVNITFDDKIYSLELIPNKCFTIHRLKNNGEISRTINYFDISQFYHYGSLETTYNKIFTKQGKEYHKRLKADDYGFPIEKINNEVIEYCIEDSIACYELAENFVSMAWDFAPIKDFYSPASIAKGVLKLNLTRGYKFLNNYLQSDFLRAYSGGRFEVIKRGSWGIDKTNNEDERLYMYDINSAYPSVLKDLEDTYGTFTINKRYEDKSFYSVYKVKVKLNDFIISPIKEYMNNLLCYPKGEFIDLYVIKSEYDILEEYDLKPEITKANHMIYNEGIKPFSWIEDMYNLRKIYKNPQTYDRRELILKLCMNSLYGVCIQTIENYNDVSIEMHDTMLKEFRDKHRNKENYSFLISEFENQFTEFISCDECGYELIKGDVELCPKCNNILSMAFRKKTYKGGQFFNPAYAAVITGNIRSKIFKDSMGKNREYENNVVMYATDSITFDKKMTHLDFSNNLGDYSKEENLKGIIMGSGLYRLQRDTGEKIEIKNRFRGFGNNDLLEIVQKNPNEKEYTIVKKTPLKLKESRTRPEDLNIFVDKEKKLSINFDNKRHWFDEPKKFGDLLENIYLSEPLTVNT